MTVTEPVGPDAEPTRAVAEATLKATATGWPATDELGVRDVMEVALLSFVADADLAREEAE